jgi:membrane protein implicated in regulation of membrane protease activity
MIWIWLGVIVLSLAVEFVSFDMVSIWFAAGGIVSLILSACGASLTWQLIFFIVVALALLLSLRKIALKYLQKGDNFKSNTDSLVGKKYKLLKAINDDEKGSIKINDVEWTAVTEDDSTIEKGEMVEIVKIKGNKVIVKKGDK